MRGFLFVVMATLPYFPSVAGVDLLEAAHDATLVEHPDGALANGAGPVFFAGRTNQSDNGVRRALLRFDAPEGRRRPEVRVVERVALVVTNLTASNESPAEYRLHRVLADWGEGPSEGSGGGGAPSRPGDATWIHTFLGDAFWSHNGGQFDGRPSARLVVTGPGAYRFESPELTRDVARMLREPDSNFGWVLVGDETRRQTVRAFGSRENPDPNVRPVLEITFRER